MTQIETSVFNGYRIQENIELMSIESAIELLKTDRQITVSTAKRVEDNTKAILTSHVLICPYCGHEIPAYARYVNEPLRARYPEDELRTDDEIDEWGAIQLSFYNPSSTILLNRVCRPTEMYKCPHCLEFSRADERKRAVAIRATETKLQITCEFLSLSEIIENSWCISGTAMIKLPAYERVTFDIENGNVYVELLTEDSKDIFVVCDVTENPQSLKKSAVWRVLKSNQSLAETFETEFKKVIKAEIPYFSHELDMEKYALMTRFVGYDRSFYDSIPFDEERWYTVEASFKQQEKQLHTAQNAIKLLENARFPNSKSVRKIFFEDQGLLFYIKECELLWDVFGDVNYFCKMLEGRRIYEILIGLHHRPSIVEFLKVKSSLHGPVHLIKEMMVDWGAVENYSARYLSLSEQSRKKEQSYWKGNRGDFFERSTRHSRPMCVINPEIKNCEIQGYKFFWLRNTIDYNRCGEALSNCLTSWNTDHNPVICVEYEGKIFAAIEVSLRGVLMVLGKNNEELTDDERFQHVLALWMERYNLKYDPDKDYFDEDDEYDNLPF